MDGGGRRRPGAERVDWRWFGRAGGQRKTLVYAG